MNCKAAVTSALHVVVGSKGQGVSSSPVTAAAYKPARTHANLYFVFFLKCFTYFVQNLKTCCCVVMLDFLDSLTTRTHGLFEDEMFEILSVSTPANDYLQISC